MRDQCWIFNRPTIVYLYEFVFPGINMVFRFQILVLDLSFDQETFGNGGKISKMKYSSFTFSLNFNSGNPSKKEENPGEIISINMAITLFPLSTRHKKGGEERERERERDGDEI